MRLFRRRCPCTPLGKGAVTDAFFRSGPSGTGISEKSTRHRTRRKRPQVGRQHRSQKPVATAVAVAAAEAKTLPANRANSGRRWRLSSPHTNARCAPPLCVAARGIGAIGQRARDKHHRAEAESGRFVANPHGAWERGSWITAHRNAGAPGGAVASTRSSQTWAWRVRPATTHGAGASGGEAAIVRPLWVRGTGRTRSPDAGRRPPPGEAGAGGGPGRHRGRPPRPKEGPPPPAPGAEAHP